MSGILPQSVLAVSDVMLAASSRYADCYVRFWKISFLGDLDFEVISFKSEVLYCLLFPFHVICD